MLTGGLLGGAPAHAVAGSSATADTKLATASAAPLANVRELRLSGNRVGVVTTDGVALVKEDLGAPWVTQLTGVKQLYLWGNRIGVVTVDGVARVKEGALNSRWGLHQPGGHVFSVVLSGDRVGLVDGRTAMVKDGPLTAPWIEQ